MACNLVGHRRSGQVSSIPKEEERTVVLEIDRRRRAALIRRMLPDECRLCNDESMTDWSEFDALLVEGSTEATEGWDFSWLDGRATEGRPSWGYLASLTQRLEGASAVLDIQTGGGETFAEALSRSERLPESLTATESWPPNVVVARRTLAPFGVVVVEAAESDWLPFEDESFDLVSSRHPTVKDWAEIYRVLEPDGLYFSQQIGAGTNSELTDFFMGPQSISDDQRLSVAVSGARRAGLEVIDAREESLPVVFFDVGAVVYFLRKVIWTVPDFSVERYRERLAHLHERIELEGRFVSHSARILLEARKPPW